MELKKTEESLNQVKGQLKTEELKSKAADVGSNIIDGLDSLVGTSEVKRQQQEIKNLKLEKHELQQDVDGLTQIVSRERNEHKKETLELKAEIIKIHDWLPDTPNLIKWREYCQKIGFSSNQAKDLINMKPVQFLGELYSSEHSQRFKVDDAEIRFDRDTERSSGFRLLINGISLTQWFRQKYDEFRKALGIKPKQKPRIGENKGFRM
ncbi:hypothetical protein EZS27_029049 [termite gut metagenome]|uniref:Mobilization protein n=1 Tax=termite gut metagenome TaxID=433724 RepID=A0A5J4QK47_9ZZZZ